ARKGRLCESCGFKHNTCALRSALAVLALGLLLAGWRAAERPSAPAGPPGPDPPPQATAGGWCPSGPSEWLVGICPPPVPCLACPACTCAGGGGVVLGDQLLLVFGPSVLTNVLDLLLRGTDGLLRGILRGRQACQEEMRAGQRVLEPLEVLEPGGERMRISLFCDGAFPPRRLGGQQVLDHGDGASLGGAPPVGGTATPLAAPPEAAEHSRRLGHAWVLAEPTEAASIGSKVDLRRVRALFANELVALAVVDGAVVRLQQTQVEEIPSYADQRASYLRSALGSPGAADLRERLGRPQPLPPPARSPAREAAAEPIQSEDIKVLAVDFDGQGERFKARREAVKESSQKEFSDQKGLAPADRVACELRSICKALYFAGCYDQVNLGALMALELAKYCAGTESAEDVAGQPARAHVARRIHEDREGQQALRRRPLGQRTPRATAQVLGAAVAALMTDGEGEGEVLADVPEGAAAAAAAIRPPHGGCRRRRAPANDALRDLNWAAGFKGFLAADHGPDVVPGDVEADVQRRTCELVSSWRPRPSADSDEAALEKLLRGHSPHRAAGGPTGVASFKLDLASRPDSASGRQLISDVAPAEFLEHLGGHRERMLAPPIDEYSAVPDFEPVLRSEGQSRVEVGPPAEAPTGSVRAAELPSDFCLTAGLSDVSNCFHRLRVVALGRPEEEPLLCHCVHVDNLGVIGAREERAGQVLEQLDEGFNREGPLPHKSEMSRGAIAALEAMLGHCAFVALRCRGLLGLSHSVYAFVERGRAAGSAQALRAECRVELQAFRGMMISQASDWLRDWSPLAAQIDSSLEDCAVAQAFWLIQAAQEAGRIPERRRRRQALALVRRPALRTLETQLVLRDRLSSAREEVVLPGEAEAATAPRLAVADDCSSTDAEKKPERDSARQAAQWRTGRQRRRPSLETAVAATVIGVSSFLEESSVTPKVLERNQSEVVWLATFAGGRELVGDEQVDSNLVDYFSHLYFKGWSANKGEQILGGLVRLTPEFSRSGGLQPPRACRCLKGWRRRAPNRSRRSWPLALWAGIAWRLVARGYLQMAVSLLASLMGLKRGGLIAPAAGISNYWNLLLFPSLLPDRSKTGPSDVSIVLDSAHLHFFAPIYEIYAQGNKDELAWSFTTLDCPWGLPVSQLPFEAM
ncbi:unnamed protein product, partial [Prorocentrum cordatum]